MSKIKNGGSDQYGKVHILDGIAGERVNKIWKQCCVLSVSGLADGCCYLCKCDLSVSCWHIIK